MSEPVIAMNTSTSPTVSPVQRCACKTSVRTVGSIDCRVAAPERAAPATLPRVEGGPGSLPTAPLACIAPSQCFVDEPVGIRLLDLDRFVFRIEFGKDAPLLFRTVHRHPAVAGEHRNLLLQHPEVRRAILAADLDWNHCGDLFGTVGVDPFECAHERIGEMLRDLGMRVHAIGDRKSVV